MPDRLDYLEFLSGATRFRHISEKLHTDGDKIYLEAGIDFKSSWFLVFFVLSRAKGPLTVMQIAEQIDFSHITVKNVLKELQSAGLVIITKNPADGRSKLASLSIRGKTHLRLLVPVWQSYSAALKRVFQAGHPDIINILNRVDRAIVNNPINELVANKVSEPISIIDYKPSLKKHFYELAGPWLSAEVNGKLKKDVIYTLQNPDEAYIKKGGFLFYAKYRTQIIGCVALKRLDEEIFEFVKLYIHPSYRNLGIATKLIERCITRCKENKATALWLQSAATMTDANRIYSRLGFIENTAPPQMKVTERTEKVMYMPL